MEKVQYKSNEKPKSYEWSTNNYEKPINNEKEYNYTKTESYEKTTTKPLETSYTNSEIVYQNTTLANLDKNYTSKPTNFPYDIKGEYLFLIYIFFMVLFSKLLMS